MQSRVPLGPGKFHIVVLVRYNFAISIAISRNQASLFCYSSNFSFCFRCCYSLYFCNRRRIFFVASLNFLRVLLHTFCSKFILFIANLSFCLQLLIGQFCSSIIYPSLLSQFVFVSLHIGRVVIRSELSVRKLVHFRST